MTTETKGKVGAPYGNWNRLVHGRRSPRKRAERAAQRQAEAAERERQFRAWVQPIEQRCKLQHAAVLKEIAAERAERAKTEPDLWGPVEG